MIFLNAVLTVEKNNHTKALKAFVWLQRWDYCSDWYSSGNVVV